MIVLHHNDLDGYCSAAIVYVWAGADTKGFSAIEMDYAKPVPFDRIKPNERVWIVDFSISVADMHKLLSITQDVIWIDHHKTAIEKMKGVQYAYHGIDLPGVRKDGEAACELTWKYIHWWSQRGLPPVDLSNTGVAVPRVVRLLGDYDTWTMQYPESVPFQEGMKMLNLAIDDARWMDLFTCEQGGVYGDGRPLPEVDMTAPIVEDGRKLIRYRDAYCGKMVNAYGYETVFHGHTCYVANVYGFGSLAFGDKMGQYDICAACIYDGNKWTVSLYSKQIDVSEICKAHGGGGHKGAAGFASKEYPFMGNPS